MLLNTVLLIYLRTYKTAKVSLNGPNERIRCSNMPLISTVTVSTLMCIPGMFFAFNARSSTSLTLLLIHMLCDNYRVWIASASNTCRKLRSVTVVCKKN